MAGAGRGLGSIAQRGIQGDPAATGRIGSVELPKPVSDGSIEQPGLAGPLGAIGPSEQVGLQSIPGSFSIQGISAVTGRQN